MHWRQALLAGLLSAPFLVQRLVNFDPGLEFKTAMAYADGFSLLEQNGRIAERFLEASFPSGAPRDCVVVLGDRDVQETLRRLGGALTGLTRPIGNGTESGGASNYDMVNDAGAGNVSATQDC